MMTETREQAREDMLNDLARRVADYIADARDGYGVGNRGVEIHRLLDDITSEVYGGRFDYCGRTHSVV